MLRATVSGSFHRHMAGIYESVGDLRARGVEVLSPSDPRVVDYMGDFLFVASDRLRSIKLVEDRHLESIRASDFLWVVCPDGYTGSSTCMEIGVAVAFEVPVFATTVALDITIGEYVNCVSSIDEVIAKLNAMRTSVKPLSHVLLDPDTVVEASISTLSDLRPYLMGQRGNRRDDAERQLNAARSKLTQSLGLK